LPGALFARRSITGRTGRRTRYDRVVPRKRFLRLVVVPIVLFAVFAGGAFALSKLHLAKPGLPKTSGKVQLGDSYRGETIFSQTCASCHGEGGKGGGIGPKLAGAPITLAAAKAQIDGGGGTMPAGLVKGQQEKDVLAYLAGILASP
jgi:mono/diheme cytochrome c family protein